MLTLTDLPSAFQQKLSEKTPMLAHAREDVNLLEAMVHDIAARAEKKITFSDASVDHLVNAYLENFYDISSRQDIGQFFGGYLLQHSAGKLASEDAVRLIADQIAALKSGAWEERVQSQAQGYARAFG